MRLRGQVVAGTWGPFLLAALLTASPTTQAKGLGLDDAREDGLRYLSQQAIDGTWGTLAPYAVEAAVANGLDPAAWPDPEHDVLAQVVVPGVDASNISLLRPVRALALADVDLRTGPHGDLVARVLGRHDPATGQYGSARVVNDDVFALLALGAAGDRARLDARQADAVQGWVAFLQRTQQEDGGWGWALDAPSGTDMTAMAQEALRLWDASTATSLAPSLAFLDSTQAPGGGHGEGPGDAPNCESTVWAIRLDARAGDPVEAADWAFLLSLQRADGSFTHLPGGPADLLCTAEAVTLLGEAHAGEVPGPARGPQGDGVLDVPAPAALSILLLPAAAVVHRMRAAASNRP